MRVLQLRGSNYRGFDKFDLRPAGHVLLVGTPSAGRSDTLSSLERVLSANSTRKRLDVWDFHNQDTSLPVAIEVTLGDLSVELKQRFSHYLELWSTSDNTIVTEADDFTEIPPDEHEWVVRLEYRATWDDNEGVGEHFVHYPKYSDVESDRFDRARRIDRSAIPFVALVQDSPLEIRTEGQFRAIVEERDPEGEFATALQELSGGVDDLVSALSENPAVKRALEATLVPLRPTLGFDRDASAIVRFSADGGSVQGLLRALGPALELEAGSLRLPLERHGSTAGAHLAAAEMLVRAASPAAVVTVDDFGEFLDASSTEYFAATARKNAAQLWLSTRRPEAGRSFAPREITRFTRDGQRRDIYCMTSEMVNQVGAVARQFSLQLLPAVSGRTLILCEGVHDAAVLQAVAIRRLSLQGKPAPAAYGARLVDSGGIEAIPKLSQLAKSLGFRVIAILDHDRPSHQTSLNLTNAQAAADAVVRLPEGFAIERAILHGLDRGLLRGALAQIAHYEQLPWKDPMSAGDDDLDRDTPKNLKARNGLHLALLDLLPNYVPNVLAECLDAVVRLSQGPTQETVQLRVTTS